ncbi:MAG TPA: IclR family transcriptional regulator [Trebonia sp.]|jgi:DNA-binding IclR family transcriptional regulator|nr:IclR family transcriptional regulator [Trebonia sp.]
MPGSPGRRGTAADEAGDDDSYAIRAIDRAIAVLNAFTIDDPALSLADIAARTGLSKPTVFRVLASLRRHGFIVQDEGRGEYRLGFAIVSLAAIRRRQTKVWEAALPFMRRVRDAVDETVLLCVRMEDERLILDQIESSQPIRRVAKIGERVPLYAGAASRVLLADLTDAEIDDYLARTRLERLGPATITDPDTLRADLRSVRELGYAVGNNERNVGGNGIAVGVRDYSGGTVAALQVTAPGERWTDDVRARALDVLQAAGRDLSAELGFQPDPPIPDIVDRPPHQPRSSSAGPRS